jgi:uncharacterized membrane protein YfhO
VLLEREPQRFIPVLQGGAARIVSYRNTEIVVETDAPEQSLLVLHDVWHPWWHATVDGVPTDIMKANVLFRSVTVPAGKHTVRFTFEPVGDALAQLSDKISALWR